MGVRILAVEDDAAIALLLEAIFDDSDYELRIAGSLQEAREVLGTYAPDVVLLDMVLPDGLGESLLPDIPRGCPVIAMTGSNRLLNSTGPVAAFVPKPFDPETLTWVLASVVTPQDRADIRAG